MKYKGWAGTILRVDLTLGKIVKQPLKEDFALKYLGGRGFNSRILYDEVPPEVAPLSPENRVCIGVGPITGSFAPASGRVTITARSPLTGIHGDSNAGGFFGPELKFAGYDQIVFQGRSEKPVYLYIDDGFVELRNASHLWGRDSLDTCDVIKEELGDDTFQTACIGPGGERMLEMGNVLLSRYRACGRTGMGSVMGSKNLKAVAVRGSGGVSIADPETLERISAETREALKDDAMYPTLSKYGTDGTLGWLIAYGGASTHNWQNSVEYPPAEVENLAGEVLRERFVIKKDGVGCWSCSVGCGRFSAITEGPYAGTMGELAEWEAIHSVGVIIGITDLAPVLKMVDMCNRYGIDVMTTGDSIAWAMECYEKGILTEEHMEGMELKWGDAEAAMKLIRMIVHREGIGALLAEGAFKAAKKIGKGSEDFIVGNKGMCGYAGFDYRTIQGWALACSVSTRGCDHLRSHGAASMLFDGEELKKMGLPPEAANEANLEGKAEYHIWHENQKAATDSATSCAFWNTWIYTLKPERLAGMIQAVTGIPMDMEKLWQIGERIYNIEKSYNTRIGLTRKDDWPPKRLFEPIPTGPSKGLRLDEKEFKKALDEYYTYRGWDIQTGKPTAAKLTQLGLEDIANDLAKRGFLPAS